MFRQLDLDFFGRALTRLRPVAGTKTRVDHEIVWKHDLKVRIVFAPRAKRYLLSLRPDGTARLVIPRRGNEAEGLKFLERSEPWLLKRVRAWRSRDHSPKLWVDGSRFLFRGEEVTLRVEPGDRGVALSFADQSFRVAHQMSDYRRSVHAYLRALATKELPVRTRELAQAHNITVTRISVRAQKARWGSCSARGAISLNWRLIQAPPFVVDYLIIHELMHRRQMNHSARYWKLVAEAFPDYRRAETWLKKGGVDLRT